VVFSGPGTARTRVACACAVGLLLLGAVPARAETPTSVVIATGQYGMRKEIPHTLGIEFQVRPPWQWSSLRPTVGLLTTANGGAFFFSGIQAEIPLPAGLQLSPGFAPGVLLSNGQGDLGSPVEFRSSLELSWSPGDAVRMGIAFSHISNARLGEHNPGVESLMLSFHFPGQR